MTMQTGAQEGPGRSPSRQSIIDRESNFNGAYVTPNDLLIEGRYEGEIECEGTVTIAQGADVNARIAAGTISVAGRLHGEIACRLRFEILPAGRVDARVLAGTIVVHEGAQYQGELRMRGEEQGESAHPNTTRPASSPRRRLPTFTPPETPAYPAQNNARTNGRTPIEEGTSQKPSNGSS